MYPTEYGIFLCMVQILKSGNIISSHCGIKALQHSCSSMVSLIEFSEPNFPYVIIPFIPPCHAAKWLSLKLCCGCKHLILDHLEIFFHSSELLFKYQPLPLSQCMLGKPAATFPSWSWISISRFMLSVWKFYNKCAEVVTEFRCMTHG